MSARRANEVAAHFRDLLQTAVSCVTKSVLVPRRGESGPLHRLWLQPEARLRSADASFEMRVLYYYNVVTDADMGYRVSPASYLYDVTEIQERGERAAVIGYHWNPNSKTDDPDFPHLHIYGEREIGGKHVHKLHIPTGRVSLEAFLRFLITELGVIPRRDSWETTLEETESGLIAG